MRPRGMTIQSEIRVKPTWERVGEVVGSPAEADGLPHFRDKRVSANITTANKGYYSHKIANILVK